ncbi:hypothetical protein ACIA5C_41195 [Actinoplanes sp. NPDC051343]|uniref:hypothetical protein n=1 Tax=Actinoplanes sp. NPDC051343 TaxID=3363906 RepID=UPI0037BB78BB
MLIFATSDADGAGRSVTSANLAYRHSLQGGDSAYLDFNFGSPTSGTIFDLPEEIRFGVDDGGMHSYLLGHVPEPRRVDVWAETQREALRYHPAGAGRIMLLPGYSGKREFQSTAEIVDACTERWSGWMRSSASSSSI